MFDEYINSEIIEDWIAFENISKSRRLNFKMFETKNKIYTYDINGQNWSIIVTFIITNHLCSWAIKKLNRAHDQSNREGIIWE